MVDKILFLNLATIQIYKPCNYNFFTLPVFTGNRDKCKKKKTKKIKNVFQTIKQYRIYSQTCADV